LIQFSNVLNLNHNLLRLRKGEAFARDTPLETLPCI